MSTFPALVPSSRIFTPGEYAATAFAGYSGKQNRVRHSNVFNDAQLRLSFVGLSEAQMLQIWNHYSTAQGTFQPFTLSAEAVSNSTIGDYVPSNYLWQYGADGSVEDLPCGGHNVTLTLEAMPSQGMAIGGLAKVVTLAITAGAAAAANGASLAVTTAVDGGTAGGPGIDATVTVSITAGSVSIIPDGIEATITASLESGLAFAANGIDAQVTCSLAGGSFGDPDFADVSLLLHMDGSNGSTTFTDSSSNGFTVTANGDAKITTTDPKFGTGALTLDGTGDYLSLAADNAFQFGTGDFTVECWVYPNNASANAGLFQIGTGATAGSLSVNTFNSQWRVSPAGTGGANMASVTTGSWQHLAVTRSGTSVRMFINGTQVGSTLTWNDNFTQDQLNIGFYFSNGFAINARIDEFRITKGVARYTSNFTAPAAAFPDS